MTLLLKSVIDFGHRNSKIYLHGVKPLTFRIFIIVTIGDEYTLFRCEETGYSHILGETEKERCLQLTGQPVSLVSPGFSERPV